MALIKWGALVTDGRGKIGGQVLSKGRSGAILRNKVTPVNRKTAAQIAARNTLTSFSQAWKALSQANRDAWNASVADYAKNNIFGDLVNPTGKNVFTKVNINLAIVGVAQVDSPPGIDTVAAMTSASIAVANGADTAVLTFAPTPVPANNAFILECTGGMSAGRNFISTEYRQVSVLDAAETTGYDFKAEYNSVFGSIPAIGTKIFFRLIGINKSTGQRGTPFSGSYIIAA